MTAPPAPAIFRFYRGTTFSSEPIVIRNPDNTPVDLTGWIGVLRIWREYADPTAPGSELFVLGNAPSQSGLVIDGPNGSIEARIEAGDTDVPVDPDGETWPFTLTLSNPNASPETYVERFVQGFVIAQP